MANEVKATDAAKDRAKELKIDLSTVKGTGKEGQITVQDVEGAVEINRQTAENQKKAEQAKSGMVSSSSVKTEQQPGVTPQKAVKQSAQENQSASRLARDKAAAYGISIEDVQGGGYASGPNGEVLASDVENFVREEGITDSKNPAPEKHTAYVKLLGGRGVVPGTGFTATIYEENKRPHSVTVSTRNANVFTEQELEAILKTGRELYGLDDSDFQIVSAQGEQKKPNRPASSVDVRGRRLSAVAQPAATAAPVRNPGALPGSGPSSTVSPLTGPGSPGSEAAQTSSGKEDSAKDDNPNDSPDESPVG